MWIADVRPHRGRRAASGSHRLQRPQGSGISDSGRGIGGAEDALLHSVDPAELTETVQETVQKHVFGATPFDLIVVDNRLPKESGIELIKRLREAAVKSKVILMTAYETPEVKSEAKRLKVDRYLRKPFDLTVLVDEVQSLIGPGGNSAAG